MTYNPNTKRKLFIFNVDNVIDIITNSSSELFVLEAETEEIVKEMVKSAHSSYENEYEQPILTKDLTLEQLETYRNYALEGWSDFRNSKKDYSVLGIAPELLYSNWLEKDAEKYWYPKLSEEGAVLLKKAIDPENKVWFMFSFEENPDWERQESLMSIASRYHLG